MKKILSFTLNGEPVQVICEDNRSLLDLIRDDLGLTGSNMGCVVAAGAAGTVMIDGRPVNSCATLAREVEGCDVVTVEGIAQNGMLHPIQKQFIEKWAFQCGYCTPGMIMSAKALLDTNPHPTELEIREAIEGNLCRCTGYVKIVEAIQAAAEEMEQEGWGENAQ